MRDYSKVSTYFKLNKKSFIIVVLTGLIYNSLLALIPVLQGYIINAIKNEKPNDYIFMLCGIMIGFVFFVQINRYLKRYYVRDFANKIVLQMREESFKNLMNLNINEIMKSTKGDIMNKQLSDIKDSAEGIRKVLTEVFDTIVLLISYFVSMMIMDYLITLATLFLIVKGIVFASLMKKLIYKATSEYKKEASVSKNMTLTAINNEVYYRGFGVSDNYYNDYKMEQDALERKSIKAMIYKTAFKPLYQSVALIGIAIAMFFGIRNVLNNVWLIGTLTAYLSTYTLVATKASKTGEVFNAMTTFKVSWSRCEPFLKPRNNEENVECINNEGLVVNDLTFGFSEDFVIKNITFNLPKGKLLGICGGVHTGKSTLGAALSGIYEYDGSITLDGVELKSCRNNSLDSFISYVGTESEIFNDSLEYNINLGEGDITEVLADVCLDYDVKEMGIDTKEKLSHSVRNLSGGQLKRLMIARGLQHNSKLMIFDNPFDSIDLEMSLRILDNIKNNYNDSSLVFINNQHEILSKMDYILYLTNDGYVISTYDELKKNKSFVDLMGGAL